MGWFSRNNHEPNTVDDEAGVGLISPKSESTANYSSEQGPLRTTKSASSVALVLSNIVWAGICLMLWRELRGSSDCARIGFSRFEADFGTCLSRLIALIKDGAEQSS
jgi:hypothetical protein